MSDAQPVVAKNSTTNPANGRLAETTSFWVDAPRVCQVVDGVAFDALTQEQVVEKVTACSLAGRGGLIVTPNVDIMRQVKAGTAADIVANSDVTTPDGMPIVWASRLSQEPLPERVTGVDLVRSLTTSAAQNSRRVFFLGAAPGVAQRAADQLATENPGLDIAGAYSPPMGFTEDPLEMQHIIDLLQSTKADFVYLAFGFPRQEQVATTLATHLPTTWFLGCGGAFDMISGDRARAPRVVQMIGLEWCHRMLLEPQRMVPRYVFHDIPFVVGLFYRAAKRRFSRPSV